MAEPSLQAVLADMRERDLRRLDPPRFCYIESLVARMDGCSEALARVLATKVRVALDAYPKRQAPGEPEPATTGASHSPLQELVACLNGEQPADEGGLEAQLKQQELALLQAVGEEQPEQADNPVAEPPRELRAARRFRSTLLQVGAERRLQQANRETLEESGPLNPQKLVTESLRIMERLSPAYLERFIAYADTLLWLEQAAAASEQDPAGD
jgi:hypothetical protein